MNWRLRIISLMLLTALIAASCASDDDATDPASEPTSTENGQSEATPPVRVADARYEPLANLDGYEVAGEFRSDVSILPTVFVADQVSLDSFRAATSDLPIRLGRFDVGSEVLIAAMITSCMPIDLFLEEADQVLTVVGIDSGYDCEVAQENFVVFEVPRPVLDRVDLNTDGSPALFVDHRVEGAGPTVAGRVEAAPYATPDQLAEFARDLVRPLAIFDGVIVAENRRELGDLSSSVAALSAWVVIEEAHVEQFEAELDGAEFDDDVTHGLIDSSGFDADEMQEDGWVTIAANVTVCMPNSIRLDLDGSDAVVIVERSGIACEEPYEFVSAFGVPPEKASNLLHGDETRVIVEYWYFDSTEPERSVELAPSWACADQADC